MHDETVLAAGIVPPVHTGCQEIPSQHDSNVKVLSESKRLKEKSTNLALLANH